MNLLTIVTVAYLLITVIRAGIRGFLKTLFSMMFLVLVIVTTLIFTPSMTKLFRGSENLQTYFYQKSEDFIEYGGTTGSASGSSAAGKVANRMVDLALSIAGVNAIEADQMTDYLMRIAATAATFILSCIVWLIIEIVIGRIRARGGAVSALDHAMGVPLGLAKGVFFVWLGLGLISLLSFSRFGVALAAQVRSSALLRYLYDHNLLAEGIRRLIIGYL